MDDRYYKKNAQLRYQLSKELDIYYKNKEKSQKSQINPFIIPLMSSAIAISTALASYFATQCHMGAKAYYIPLRVGVAFAVIYLLTRFIFYPIVLMIITGIKNFKPINERFYKTLPEIQKKKLLAKFDFDITGLIHLSYVIATDAVKNDLVLNEYNRGEALFYIDRSIKKLKNVFIDYPLYTPNIYEYRIRNNMDLLSAAIVLLSKSNSSDTDSLKFYIHNAITQYNQIGRFINKKYDKEIVSLINENDSI